MRICSFYYTKNEEIVIKLLKTTNPPINLPDIMPRVISKEIDARLFLIIVF